MKNSILLSILICILGIQNNFAQDTPKSKDKFTAHNKGKFFINYGGNRDHYSKSDITFKGDDYNFTLYDVEAHDKPKGWHIDYINPSRLSIPQTNFRMGYYFSDKYSISLGVDHMKYVMFQNKAVDYSGNYPGEGTNAYGETLPNGQILLTEAFLKFEHTDGLNYINTEITRLDDVSKLFGFNTDKFQLNTVLGGGIGVLFPRTDATVLSKPEHDDFHLSGYGASLKLGLNITFFKYFFIQSEVKGGYINMPDIRTTNSSSDTASQKINFLQTNIVFGTIFKI